MGEGRREMAGKKPQERTRTAKQRRETVASLRNDNTTRHQAKELT